MLLRFRGNSPSQFHSPAINLKQNLFLLNPYESLPAPDRTRQADRLHVDEQRLVIDFVRPDLVAARRLNYDSSVRPDLFKWSLEPGYIYHREKQYYIDGPEIIRVGKRNPAIEARTASFSPIMTNYRVRFYQ